jgi:hypothetical protein
MLHRRVALFLILCWLAAGLATAQSRPSFAAVQDATGALLGPVVDAPKPFAVFSVEVGGRIALLQADRTTLSGVGDASVWFATADCTGQAYLQWVPSYISPPSSIGGPANTVYVGDPAAPQAAGVVAHSRYFGAGGACQPYPATTEYFVPVDAVGVLPATPPFTLVPFPAATAQAVPAVAGWGLLALGLLLAAAAFFKLRRTAGRTPR